MKAKLTNRWGFTLILTLIVMVFLSMLFLVSFTLMQNNSKQIRHQDKNLQAYYLARSGTNLAYTALIEKNNLEVIKDNELTQNIEIDGNNISLRVWYKDSYIFIESVAEEYKELSKAKSILKFKIEKPEEITWIN